MYVCHLNLKLRFGRLNEFTTDWIWIANEELNWLDLNVNVNARLSMQAPRKTNLTAHKVGLRQYNFHRRTDVLIFYSVRHFRMQHTFCFLMFRSLSWSNWFYTHKSSVESLAVCDIKILNLNKYWKHKEATSYAYDVSVLARVTIHWHHRQELKYTDTIGIVRCVFLNICSSLVFLCRMQSHFLHCFVFFLYQIKLLWTIFECLSNRIIHFLQQKPPSNYTQHYMLYTESISITLLIVSPHSYRISLTLTVFTNNSDSKNHKWRNTCTATTDNISRFYLFTTSKHRLCTNHTQSFQETC